MRLMTGILCIIVSGVIALSSCKKNDASPGNFFSYNNQTYSVNSAFYFDLQTNGEVLIFSDLDASTVTSNSKVNYTAMQLGVPVTNNLLPTGTFTYLDSTNSKYDKSKNFSKAGIILNGTLDLNSFTIPQSSIQSGAITIAKNDTGYVITYTFVFSDGRTLAGAYTGIVNKI
ncbi:hypothetical protein ACI6Q2_10915 [Chitinophagaceae bacterium LWZ2-11]